VSVLERAEEFTEEFEVQQRPQGQGEQPVATWRLES
jgi:hypothetical protein